MQLSKTIIALLILLLSAATALSALHSGMMIDSHGNMAPCPLMAAASFCRMNIAEHLNLLQSLFTATTPATVLLLFAVVLLFVISSSKNLQEAHSEKTTLSFVRHRNLDILALNPLRLAFSKGILNPKTYELVAAL